MKAPRLHELTARVVAWHNRHPLARRIDATQVHSIGEVGLPFASAAAWGEAPAVAAPAQSPAAQGPTLAEALAQRIARQQTAGQAPGIDGLEVQSMLPADDAALFDAPAAPPAAPADIDLGLDAPAPGGAADPQDDADGETALVIPLLDGDDPPGAAADAATAPDTEGAGPPADPGTAATAASHSASPATASAPPADGPLPGAPAVQPDTVYPPPHGAVPASALARAVERRAAARGAGGHPAHDDGAPLAPAPPAGRWRRLLAALRRPRGGRRAGLPPLRAAFSREFIWPLQPAQVARWAQQHGQPQAVAPADWPRRQIETDPALLAQCRQRGMAHDLPLHVLTAAIGVGDRRIRVLVGADGSILGPRAYHPARLGGVGMLLAIGLVGLGWSLRPLHGLPDDGGASALAAAATPAASAPLPAASAVEAPASGAILADAASAADGAASQVHAEAPAEPAASAADSAHAAVAEALADAAASQPQASIRPAMSDEERYAARVESARLRGEPVPPPPATLLPGPVYAVVSPASRQRAAAAGSLAQMKSAASRLDGQVPEHGELVESQGQWRAAWWPFTSLVDAERARVLLAGRGIKAEVVEF